MLILVLLFMFLGNCAVNNKQNIKDSLKTGKIISEKIKKSEINYTNPKQFLKSLELYELHKDLKNESIEDIIDYLYYIDDSCSLVKIFKQDLKNHKVDKTNEIASYLIKGIEFNSIAFIKLLIVYALNKEIELPKLYDNIAVKSLNITKNCKISNLDHKLATLNENLLLYRKEKDKHRKLDDLNLNNFLYDNKNILGTSLLLLLAYNIIPENYSKLKISFTVTGICSTLFILNKNYCKTFEDIKRYLKELDDSIFKFENEIKNIEQNKGNKLNKRPLLKLLVDNDICDTSISFYYENN